MKIAIGFVAGLTFGLGLALSGMTSPDRVLGFLDIAGAWDPSLAFVMGGAVLTALPLFALARRRTTPLAGVAFDQPPTTLIDRRLIGAAHDLHLLQVEVTEPGWVDRYRAGLAEHGAVHLTATAESRHELAAAIGRVPLIGVDRDVLRVYGEVRHIDQDHAELRARVEIREVLQ